MKEKIVGNNVSDLRGFTFNHSLSGQQPELYPTTHYPLLIR